MAQQTVVETLQRYLEDAIAAEKSFEAQLRANAKDTDQDAARMLFEQHADETRLQHQRLETRLQALGGKESGLKSFLGQVFSALPKPAQVGHDPAERGTQNLMAAYAVEHGEIAMYEALANAASLAGDTETEQLAREIQQEERRAAERVWSLIGPSSRDSFSKVTGGASARHAA